MIFINMPSFSDSIFLFVLALVIHFILLSTDRFNWLEGHPLKTGQINPTTQSLVVTDIG